MIQVSQFVDEPIENVVNGIFTLNVNFAEYVEHDNDLFTTEPEKNAWLHFQLPA